MPKFKLKSWWAMELKGGECEVSGRGGEGLAHEVRTGVP